MNQSDNPQLARDAAAGPSSCALETAYRSHVLQCPLSWLRCNYPHPNLSLES